MTALEHAPHCARSRLNLAPVVIGRQPYLLTRCAVCGAQILTKEPTNAAVDFFSPRRFFHQGRRVTPL